MELLTLPEIEENPRPILVPGSGVAFVILPTEWLDRCSDAWMDVLHTHVQTSVTVNMAIFSSRLIKAGVLPGHHVVVDNPKRLGSKGHMDWVDVEAAYRREGLTTWGGYDYWMRTERIIQAKSYTASGAQLPYWRGPDEIGPDDDGRYTVAGQYTSCSACNIAAHVMGWKGRVFILGNQGKGRYCKIAPPLKSPRMREKMAEVQDRAMSADDQQWGYLRARALEYGTEIIHVGDSPTLTVPRMSSEEALKCLL